MMNKKLLLSTLFAAATLPALGFAQDGEEVAMVASDEFVWIMNSLLFLIGGFLVFFMAAGFAMLEGGLVRSKNATMQMTKNVALFSIAAIMYWLIGYNLMYPLGDWAIEGYFSALFPVPAAPRALFLDAALQLGDL
ncbi:MAG: ammonium transporter, partial [Pseudomonadota bacterium]